MNASKFAYEEEPSNGDPKAVSAIACAVLEAKVAIRRMHSEMMCEIFIVILEKSLILDNVLQIIHHARSSSKTRWEQKQDEQTRAKAQFQRPKPYICARDLNQSVCSNTKPL
jgi:hypothetical protein